MTGANKDLRFLSALTALEYLDLTSVRFNPEQLQHIRSPHLTYLQALINNPQSAHLSHLTQLETIDINNETFAMECVKDLTRLKALSCSRATVMKDWLFLTALTNLQLLAGFILPPMAFDYLHSHLTSLTLKVPEEHLHDTYTSLANFKLKRLLVRGDHNLWSTVSLLTDLEYLLISGARSDDDVTTFQSLTRLTQLFLQGANITGTTFTKLTSLQLLNIASPPFDRNYLTGMPYLFNVNVLEE